MKRILFGSLTLLFSSGASAWAQEAAPKAEPEAVSSLTWVLMLIPVLAFVFLMVSLSKRQKNYGVSIDRSLQIGEESLQLARQQIALQEETNRLLGQLLSARGQGDRT